MLWVTLADFPKLDDLSRERLTKWVRAVMPEAASAISKASPMRRTVSSSNLWLFKYAEIGMKRGSTFWQRFWATYQFRRNFGRESWWRSFLGAIRAAWRDR